MKTYVLLILTSLLTQLFNANIHAQEKLLPVIDAPPPGNGGGFADFATVFSNFQTLKREDFKKHEVEFQLKDGTRVGGLFFAHKSKRLAPLLIGTFGFLSDRWSAPAGQFVKNYILEKRIDAHVLVLDHPSSAPFLAYNGNLSPGGYDEAQMILEVTGQFLESGSANYSSVHLIGVSMGANTTFHTLREDKRLGANYFSSAVTFSGVINLNAVPRKQLALYDPDTWGDFDRSLGDYAQKLAVKFLLNHFQNIYFEMTKTELDFSEINPGRFFYEKYLERIQVLNKNKSNLDPKISFQNLDSYLKSQLLTQHINDLDKPIYMVHSIDDPAVPFSQFESMVIRAQKTPYITTQTLKHGGHWGYTWSYGKEWMSTVVNAIFEFHQP